MRRALLFLFTVFSLYFPVASAQKNAPGKKYPSLFWEISGNGLQKPSYLFGTMHVSSKMVFHLSDSFYYAMRNADAVALELNPEVWQDEMFRLQKAQINLARFSLGRMNDYLKESSFKLDRYEDDIKKALTEEPTVVNNLLYRSFQSTADFEENTYLDLYIFQTGRKLGKRPAGVENYMESERLMMEAYQDMAKEKNKRRLDTDGESFYEIQKKIQQAYRNGDLDLMDSLQNITSTSAAFSEKFLYVRNEIQANSIDTIIKKHSLFVGVGAAHLPGPRGVIELLRRKGYRLRPIFMQDRDASQKEEIDKLKVPVAFKPETTSDGLIHLELPGKLYKREEARGNESWQYADMNNGSYYMLTRVRTHAAMLGNNEKVVFNKVDSMLYENIPGKILKKTIINKNGFAGFDITNRTRRGDLQRYQILVTPYEVLVFKMSGIDSYVDGKEADFFFNSIKIRSAATIGWADYTPHQGGFTIKLPGTVNEAHTKTTGDGGDRWEYEAIDHTTGNAYMVWKKSIYNFNFIDEDTFDINLIDESFKSSDIIGKQLSRRALFQKAMPFVECLYSLKDGSFVTTKAFIKGPDYYLLAARSSDNKTDADPFFNSFTFSRYNYSTAGKYVDSALSLEVITPVKPNVDTLLRSWMEKSGGDMGFQSGKQSYLSWPKVKTGIFKSDSTGESILVSVQTFPKYYYSRDSSQFWQDKLEEQQMKKDLIFKKKEYYKLNDSVCGYNILLTDTNSSRCIKIAYYLKGNNLFKFSTLTDTSGIESDFVKTFFATAKPVNKYTGASVFQNKMNLFFADYNSKDSVLKKQARSAIPNVYYGKEGWQRIVTAINSLTYRDNDYFDVKSKFITELGYINDSSSREKLVDVLSNLYNKSVDTSSFQSAILGALARLQTASSFTLCKNFLVQDPPIFDEQYEYERIFNRFSDSLKLAKTLFPEILQLASLEDYKPYVNKLLNLMVDSGYLKASDYESYFSKLYFDAKVELKKLQNKDEKMLEKENGDDDRYNNSDGDYADYDNNDNSANPTTLSDYINLLMPFYDKFPSVPKFFDKLLQSRNTDVRLTAMKVLLSSNKKLPDSVFTSIAQKDRYRIKLFELLKELNRKELFPGEYKTQELMARSILLNDKNDKEFASIQLVNKRPVEVNGSKGVVYLFKYKTKKDDDWKMGISGLQPFDVKKISSDDDLVKMTNKKLKASETEVAQFNDQLKKLLFAKHRSARRFYDNSGGWDFSDGGFDN